VSLTEGEKGVTANPIRAGDVPAISIQGLIKDYRVDGCAPAVNGLTLEVHEGETFGLLGPNGAGKTTTVSVCATRTPPTSGEVRITGRDVRRESTRVKRDIGVVTQWNTLDRACSVWHNLYFHCRFFAMSRREATARTAELLELFKLGTRAKARPIELSGGMAQRLQIARAIAHRPRVLFLDEPTSGLDPQSRLSLWEAVNTLKRDGTTVFLTTHYMEEADQLCDRVGIMDHGRMLVCGPPAELKRALPAARIVTLSLAAAPNGLTDRLRALAGVRSVEPAGDGLRIHTGEGHAPIPQIVTAVGNDLLDLSVSAPSLESVFISLTGRELRD
jgi:ABC-2 type transport system ATP-binding protein